MVWDALLSSLLLSCKSLYELPQGISSGYPSLKRKNKQISCVARKAVFRVFDRVRNKPAYTYRMFVCVEA